MTIIYAPLSAFDDDPGTLWADEPSQPIPLSEFQQLRRSWRRSLLKRVGKRPLIWFVDDERANREWFAARHRRHFSVITFSSRRHVRTALDARTPCDAVVTDIFFPAAPVTSDAEASKLSGIYDQIDRSTVADLKKLWLVVRPLWSLDGFEIAKDVSDCARERNELIPVLLFSRKATLLLRCEDWLADPAPVVENTHWMIEKVDPSERGDSARIAAAIQRDRITAALKFRQAAAPMWLKMLKLFKIELGPLHFSIRSDA